MTATLSAHFIFRLFTRCGAIILNLGSNSIVLGLNLQNFAKRSLLIPDFKCSDAMEFPSKKGTLNLIFGQSFILLDTSPGCERIALTTRIRAGAFLGLETKTVSLERFFKLDYFG